MIVVCRNKPITLIHILTEVSDIVIVQCTHNKHCLSRSSYLVCNLMVSKINTIKIFIILVLVQNIMHLSGIYLITESNKKQQILFEI